MAFLGRKTRDRSYHGTESRARKKRKNVIVNLNDKQQLPLLEHYIAHRHAEESGKRYSVRVRSLSGIAKELLSKKY